MVEGDQEKYFKLSNNSEVMQYITGYALTRAESDEMLHEFLMDNTEESWVGRYFVCLKASGEIIGTAKLDLFEGAVEIGYRLGKEYWGKGYGTEIANLLINIGLVFFKGLPIIAFVNSQNVRSIKVLEKAGMVLKESLDFENELRLKYIYQPKLKWYMRKILYIIFGLLVLVVVAAIVMPKEYAVQREVVINQPNEAVFEYLKYLENQEEWSVWASLDPAMKKHYTGTPGTVGSTYRWESEKDDVGVGEQEIKGITESQRIDFELRFEKPFESTSQAYLISESIDSTSTRVQWGFDGSMPIPMNLMMPFLDIENAIGKDFSTGLANLKEILEK